MYSIDGQMEIDFKGMGVNLFLHDIRCIFGEGFGEKWILNFMADIIQNPYSVPRVAPMFLTDDKGVRWIVKLLNCIFGKEGFKKISMEELIIFGYTNSDYLRKDAPFMLIEHSHGCGIMAKYLRKLITCKPNIIDMTYINHLELTYNIKVPYQQLEQLSSPCHEPYFSRAMFITSDQHVTITEDCEFIQRIDCPIVPRLGARDLLLDHHIYIFQIFEYLYGIKVDLDLLRRKY